MKKLLFIITIAVTLLACNKSKTEAHGHDHNDGSHQHTEAEMHPEELRQEEFSVDKDSAASPMHNAHDEHGQTHQH